MGKRSDEVSRGAGRDPDTIDEYRDSYAANDMSMDSTVDASYGVTEPYGDDLSGDIASEGVDVELDTKRQEIEQTRAEMSGTIDAIQRKLSPEQLTQQAKDAVREATIGKVEQAVSDAGTKVQDAVGTVTGPAGDVKDSIVETIRQNPIPALLAGVGLGWLWMSRRHGNQPRNVYQATYPSSGRSGYGTDTFSRYGYSPSYGQQGYARGTEYRSPAGAAYGYQSSDAGYTDEHGTGVTDKARETVSQAQDMAGQAAGTVQDAAGQALEGAQQAAGQAMDQVSGMAGQAQDMAQQAMSGFERMMRDNPVALGIVSLAAGAAIGLALPETHKEDVWLGEARDSFVERAQDTAQQALHKVEDVAQGAVGAAQEAVQQQMSPDQSGEGQSSGTQAGASTTSAGSRSSASSTETTTSSRLGEESSGGSTSGTGGK